MYEYDAYDRVSAYERAEAAAAVHRELAARYRENPGAVGSDLFSGSVEEVAAYRLVGAMDDGPTLRELAVRVLVETALRRREFEDRVAEAKAREAEARREKSDA